MAQPTDTPAIFAAAGCGCHQPVLGAIVVGGVELEPFIYSDFKNDIHEKEGVATTLAALWEEDEEWFDFDPATHVIPGEGIVPGASITCGPVLKAEHGLTAGFVAVITANLIGTTDGGNVFIDRADLPDYNNEHKIMLYIENEQVLCKVEDYDDQQSVMSAEPLGRFKLACKTNDTEIAASAHGGMVASLAVAPVLPTPRIGLSVTGDHALEIVALYNIVDVDNAELPGLSAP